VLNAALHTTQFWDGRSKDVEEQAGMPILNPVEMAIPDEQFLVDRLKQDENYPTLFKNAFPDQEDPLTYENIRLALAVFERELLTPSPFDDFLKGDANALNDQQKEGLNTFIDVGCITCHTGPLMGGNMFQKFGVYGDYWKYTKSVAIDEGRFKETKKEADRYLFKVPSLRNISETDPYFHDGSVANLNDVIQIMAEVQLDKKLSMEEVNQINAFLKSLSAVDGVKAEYQKAPLE
jgi:cytochrome c peroxidase